MVGKNENENERKIEVPERLAEQLEDDYDIQKDDIIIEQVVECDACGEKLYKVSQETKGIEDIESCFYCGWEECTWFNDWGDREHPEWTYDYYHNFNPEDDRNDMMCYGCRERLSYGESDGTIIYVSPYENEIKKPFKGGIVPDFEGDLLEIPDEYLETIGHIVMGTHWHSTDAWRGHMDIDTDSDVAVKVHTDCSLAYSEDSQKLKEFDDAVEELFLRKGIPLIKVFTRTSNVFSTGYDLFVRAEDYDKEIEETVEKLKEAYRDPHRFFSTAITGKDPDEQDEKDEMLTLIASLMDFDRGDDDE